MILTCPECATSYFVPDDRLGPDGRRVRCQSCGFTWRASADDPLELTAVDAAPAQARPPAETSDEPAPARREDLAEAPAPELPRAFRARAEHQRRMRRAAAVGAVWAGLGCAFLGLVAAAWMFRVQVVELYPRAASAYALAGAPVNPVGLEFQSVGARPAPGRPGRVLVSGALRNVRDHPVASPVVRVALLDAEGAEIGHQMLTVPGEPIAPGAVLGFATIVPDPDARAADIGLNFALDATPQPATAREREPAPQQTPAPPLRPALDQQAAVRADQGLRPALDVDSAAAAPVEAVPLDSEASEAVSPSGHG